MPKFHMKKDQSAAGECFATERACPNGEFGHYDSEYEVYMAYEYAVANGKLPGLSMLISLKKDEVAQQRLVMAAELGKAKTDQEYVNAIAWNIHPLDASEQLRLLELHKGATAKDVAVRAELAKLTNSSKVLEEIANGETDEHVASTALSNKHMSDSDATYLAGKHSASALVGISMKQRAQARAGQPQARTLPRPDTPRPAAKRTNGEVASAMVTAAENFNEHFGKIDANFRALSKEFADAGEPEIARAFTSQRSYSRAHMGGGITIDGQTKSCLTRVGIDFEVKLTPEQAQKAASGLQPYLDKNFPGYTATANGSQLSVKTVSEEELASLRAFMGSKN